MVFEEIPNAVCRILLRGPETEFGGGVHPPPRSGVSGAEHRPGAIKAHVLVIINDILSVDNWYILWLFP